MDLPKGLGGVLPDAPKVRDGAVLSDIQALIDAAAQMLGKMPVDVLADGSFSGAGVQGNDCHE
jgi:hypothetical protein